MNRISKKLNDDITIHVEGETHKDLFKQLASLGEVFCNTECGCCHNEGGKGTFFVVRHIDDNDFYEMRCRDCFAKLTFGQSKKNSELYPKRRWDQLSDKGATPEVEQRAPQKKYADENNGYLPDSGWFNWMKLQQEKENNNE